MGVAVLFSPALPSVQLQLSAMLGLAKADAPFEFQAESWYSSTSGSL